MTRNAPSSQTNHPHVAQKCQHQDDGAHYVTGGYNTSAVRSLVLHSHITLQSIAYDYSLHTHIATLLLRPIRHEAKALSPNTHLRTILISQLTGHGVTPILTHSI